MRNKFLSTAIGLAALATLGLTATVADAAPITRTFAVSATNFTNTGSNSNVPSPVDTALLSFTVTFDPAVTAFDQTSGISLISFNLPLGSQLGFDHNATEDWLLVGGMEANANVLGNAAPDFALVIFDVSTSNPTGFAFAFRDGTPNATFRAGMTSVSIVTNDVPEPMSLALFGMGLAGIAAARRRKGGTAATIA